jgi:hypothetical protein
MIVISRFDISIAKLRGRGRQTSDPPEAGRLRAHPRILLTLVDRPLAVNARAHGANDVTHPSRSRERADGGAGERDRGMSPVACR